MPRPPVIGLGAGGHARVVLEALAAQGVFEPVALLDPRTELWGREIDGVPVLGGDDLLDGQYDAGVSRAFIGLGGVGDTAPRRRLYELARARGFEIVSVIHPAAVVSPSAAAGEGATILANAVVGAGVVLGRDVTVNTGAIVEHDSVVADHVHVASGARLASSVEVGEGAHIGIGATVIQGIRVGAGAVVGAGAAVVRDVEPGAVVVGVPARALTRTES